VGVTLKNLLSYIVNRKMKGGSFVGGYFDDSKAFIVFLILILLLLGDKGKGGL